MPPQIPTTLPCRTPGERRGEQGQAERDLVLPALIANLDPGSERRPQVLIPLAKSASAPIQAAADRVVLHQLEDGTAAADLDVCRYAEEHLYRSERASDDLLAIVRHIISAPPGSGRDALAFPLAGPLGLRDITQRRTLLVEFVEASPDTNAHARVIRTLVDSIVGSQKLPGAFDLLQQVLARLDPSRADYLLFREAIGRGEFASLLAQWLTTGRLTPPGNLTRRLSADFHVGGWAQLGGPARPGSWPDMVADLAGPCCR